MLVLHAKPIKLPFIARLPEWALGLIMAALAVRMLMPGEQLGNPNYARMRDIATEEVWGMWFAAVGGLRLVSLALNSHWRWSSLWTTHARAITAFLGAMTWLKMGYAIHFANAQALISILLWGMAGIDFVLFYTIGYQAGHKDREHYGR
jgi:hypothetical protein